MSIERALQNNTRDDLERYLSTLPETVQDDIEFLASLPFDEFVKLCEMPEDEVARYIRENKS